MNDNIWDLSKPRITVHPDDAIADILAYANTIPGQPTTANGYNSWPQRRYSKDTIRRLFGDWSSACEKANIPFKKTHQYTIEHLISHIEKVAEWRKARPSIEDLRRYNDKFGTTITYDAYKRRWGGYKLFIEAFAQFKMGQISKDELTKLADAKPKRKTISASLRAKVFERDNWRCKDCGKSASDDVTLHVHHINPVSHGGVNDLDNLVTNCSDCNLGKSDKILR